ncbi:transposase IS3/IS911 family protein [alpha proteobacterium BAL199]|jgi:transposase|nr:transposase IS3/IS911 family protein [alpha proteobacterium BAL199]EDP66767.1 transposase IS3/IS911 family protein [alpha proteobacterium BAL199]
MHTDNGFAGRLDVVTAGRRRRWSAAAKLRIVEDSLAGDRQASATARRHDVPVSLLFTWRKAYRDGRLGGPTTGSPAGSRLVPAVLMACAADASAVPSGSGGRMEIVLGDGRRVVIGRDVDAAALTRVLDVLERRG